MQLNLTPLASIGVAAAIILIIAALYYWFEYRPDMYIRTQANIHDFNELKFIESQDPATFDYYNDRWSQGFFIGFIAFFVILLPCAYMRGIFVPIGLAAGGLSMVVIVMTFNYKQKLDEIEEAGKGPTINSICYFQKHGPKNLKMRAMELQTQAELDSEQKDVLADTARNIIDGMDEMKEMQFSDKERKSFLDNVRDVIRKRLDEAFIYRYICDGSYSIVLITKNMIGEMKMPKKQRTLFKSYHIPTEHMPMWSIFCGTTKKLFENVGKKGVVDWTTKEAGIILDMFDWADFWNLITTGDFVVADKATSLIGSLVHLTEQNSVTNTSINKAKSDRIGALREVETKNNIDLYKTIGDMITDMLKELAKANAGQAPRPKIDYFMAVFMIISFTLLGLIIGIFTERARLGVF